MPQYQIPPTTELARIPSVAELEAKLAALVVVPHQLPTAPREAHRARAEYLEKKEHLTTLLSMAKAIEKNGWRPVPGRPGPADIRANPARICGGGPKKTLADWIREFEVCVERMAGLPPGTETWMQTRQRAYQVRVEIREKAAKLGRPMPALPAIPRERDEEAASQAAEKTASKVLSSLG